MTKLMKIISLLLSMLVDLALLIFIVFIFAIRTSPIQTLFAKQAATFLSSELGTKIKIDEVAIVFIDRIALKGVFIEDKDKKVLANLKTILVNLDALDLVNNQLTIKNILLEEGQIQLNRDSLHGDYNYEFLVDYFGSSQSSSGSKPMALLLKKLELENVDFKYDDFRKNYSTFGMDWDHLDFKKVNLIAKDINIVNGDVTAEIKQLATKEKCGFILSNFSAKVKVNQTGIHLKNFNFNTPKSDVHFSHLSMKMHGLEDIYTFEDSVKFDAALLPSHLSLHDISFFATALEGMDQELDLQAKISDNVHRLKIEDFELITGRRTKLAGSVRLPNFNHLEEAIFNERLRYAFIDLKDLQKIKLPVDQRNRYISLDDMTNRFKFFEGKNVKIDGFYHEFVLSSQELNSGIGRISIDNGLLFSENKAEGGYSFTESASENRDIVIHNFDLGTLLNDLSFGQLNGAVSINGLISNSGEIQFNNIHGKIDRFDYLGYSYQNLKIEETSLIDNVVVGKIEVEDDNLNMVYDGRVDFSEKEQISFTVDLQKAILDNLGLSKQENSLLKSKFSVELVGLDPEKISGKIFLSGLIYTENDKKFDVPSLTIDVERGQSFDKLDIRSKVADIAFQGKVDFENIAAVFEDQLSRVLPALFKPKDQNLKRQKNHFTYDIKVKEINDFLAIFVPKLNISEGTHVQGDYDELNQEFKLQLQSDRIDYDGYEARNVSMSQSLIANQLDLQLSVGQFKLNDSISVQNLSVNTDGSKDIFTTEVHWNPELANESKISWNTKVESVNDYVFELYPSFLTIKNKKWDIKNKSTIVLRKGVVSIDDFLFERDKQYISINGRVSKSDEDKILLKISHLQLEDFGAFLQSPMDIQGELNGYASISNPFENFAYTGDASIKDLIINKEEVGNIFIQSNWAKGKEKIEFSGDLSYRQMETFSFLGDYHLNRKTDNLDFILSFDNTDISFTNAFLDPQVVGNIKGRLNGILNVSGTPDQPKLNGKIKLSDGNAFIALLGVNIKTKGEIKVDEYGIYMDNIPLIDEEGNTGSAIGSIYHDNFTNWNFDLSLNLEDDLYQRDPLFKWKPKPLNRFLILNTKYNQNEAYYGKGYATGLADITGYADNLYISANVKTQRGTQINFPMYGASDIDEEESFITFLNKDTVVSVFKEKLDLTGVDLDLNFDVTPDARLKIIFDEKLGDEITAEGLGNISLNVNNFGDIALDGTFTVKDGVYNFALGPVKQNFYIKEGGYVTWTGDPYNANLNISSYYKVQANLAEISSDQLSGQGSANQDIFCYLDITESLLRPKINFDIQAPKGTESGKALLNRVKSDPDELNRQFFSLLLWKRFQPLKGSNAVGGGAALDLAANQINSMLSQLSNSYELAVNLDANALTGDRSFEVGVSKEFLDDRLTISGSFGVENATNSANTSQNYLIGDVNLEYSLNESGTFRAIIFNESNQNRILQNNSTGLFKQGVGLHYQEDFNNVQTFKAGQYFLDIFRKKTKKKFPAKKKRQQTAVPTLKKDEE